MFPNVSSFQDVLQWVIANGYFFIFLLMCIEGPITTAAAGFASALGYFDPFIIFTLSILGDLIPDTTYYAIGYQGRERTAERFSRRFGQGTAWLENTAQLLKKHFDKTVVILKLTPIATPLGFILIGALHLSFRRFIWLCSAITLPKTIIFLMLGYFFGGLYAINSYLHYAGVLFPALIIGSIIIFLIYRKTIALIADHIGN